MSSEAFDTTYWRAVENRDAITAQFHTHGTMAQQTTASTPVPVESVAETMPMSGPDTTRLMDEIRYGLSQRILALAADLDSDPAEQARNSAMLQHPSMYITPPESLDEDPVID